MKNGRPRRGLFLLMIIVGFILLIPSVFVSDCGGRKNVRGNGDITTVSRSVAGFSQVSIHGNIDLEITQGDKYEVRLKGDENLLRYINLDKNGNELIVKIQNGIRISSDDPIKIFISMPLVTKINMVGSGDAEMVGKFSTGEKFQLEMAGSGDFEGSLNCPVVEVNIMGSGDARLHGETRQIRVNVMGSGKMDGLNLKSEEADVNVAGSGGVSVYASQELKVNILGSGDVRFAGNPVNVERNVIGSGDLKSAD